MAEEQLSMAIGRIEQALSRIEHATVHFSTGHSGAELAARHKQLIVETKAAISEIDIILGKGIN